MYAKKADFGPFTKVAKRMKTKMWVKFGARNRFETKNCRKSKFSSYVNVTHFIKYFVKILIFWTFFNIYNINRFLEAVNREFSQIMNENFVSPSFCENRIISVYFWSNPDMYKTCSEWLISYGNRKVIINHFNTIDIRKNRKRCSKFSSKMRLLNRKEFSRGITLEIAEL